MNRQRRKTKVRKEYKNWNNLKSIAKLNGLTVRVEYFNADLDLHVTGRVIPQVPTTAVAIWVPDSEQAGGQLRRFIGVAQMGPGEDYIREHGRDVAAARAIKALERFDTTSDSPNDVYTSSDEKDEILVYGHIPDTVDISDHLVVDRQQVQS